jgi:uncharacterized OB-fold protein
VILVALVILIGATADLHDKERRYTMQAHGELTYCPNCDKEVYPASKPCRNCGYPDIFPGKEVITIWKPSA